MADYLSNLNDGATFDALMAKISNPSFDNAMAKINDLTIINNLWSTDIANPLSAYQGHTLFTYLQTGWIPQSATLTYSSADSPIFVVGTLVDLTSLIGVKDRIKLTQNGATIYAIVVAITASTITLLVESGKAIANTTTYPITNVFYSHVSNPYGFPNDIEKWSVEVSISVDTFKTMPTANVWYNISALNINVPIGLWDLGFCGILYTDRTAAGAVSCLATLSTANNSEIDRKRSAGLVAYNTTAYATNVCSYRKFEATAKTPIYFNVKSITTDNVHIGIGGVVDFVVRAKSLYL